MRATKSSVSTEGTLIADYEAAIGESLSREQMRSALHAARAQAEMAIRARSDFLANMNHELRTPLNAIIGFTTMVRDAQGLNLSDEQKQDYCDYILQSADLLLGHVNTLLEVAELEKGDVVFNAERVDIVEVLDNVLARAARPAETAKLIIEKNACGEEAYAVIDALRLGQALDELMKIALRVTPEGGKIFVRVKRSEDGDIEIAIRDEGPG
ncbi:MAG: histidine kinase dimerization/phospho-acceptor domain-containing protein, partial [Pseudomonadota bacterium]